MSRRARYVPAGFAAAGNGASEKRYLEGTHRVRSPEETWEWIVDLLPLAGITRVADVTALDRLGIPVFQAVRPAGLNLSVSQGKAVTAAAARVSAAMEALELWHAERLDHLPQVVLSMREMEYGNPIPTSALKLRTDTLRLDAMPMPWVEATSLLEERPGWLPKWMLELDFRVSPLLRPNLFHLSSNGLASGNCFEEALLHGLCEVIERQGLYRAHKNPELKVAIDPDSIGELGARDDSTDRSRDYVEELILRMRRAGMKLALYDLTWDLGLPVMLVDLVADDLPHIWRGAGCHPSPRVALSRALTEAAQARLTYISGARDDITRFPREVDPASRYQAFAEPSGQRRFGDIPSCSTHSIDGDIDSVVGRLEAAGYEPFYVDLGRPEVGVPVVLSFVPGFSEAPHV